MDVAFNGNLFLVRWDGSVKLHGELHRRTWETEENLERTK
jgi:hypothetical protein